MTCDDCGIQGLEESSLPLIDLADESYPEYVEADWSPQRLWVQEDEEPEEEEDTEEEEDEEEDD